MTKGVIDAEAILNRARPLAHQEAPEIQPYGHLVKLPIALAESACREGVENLNQLLADTITLRDLYKKHHWQVAGPTFYQLHLLFDKHSEQQNELVDSVSANASAVNPARFLAIVVAEKGAPITVTP
jgi:starvation-inducible DNA-binding protein